ncbi:TIGR02281 family clan AA aspartic protease [uncultured Sphingomonas sp.]|uniref:retropepsin-like aspartic protease family protein n=1 Tax=uncultured Sphingomonas sp. TaxID=158754 RepID=UPI0035C9ADDC
MTKFVVIDGGEVLMYALLLILPLSALATRRVPLARVALMAFAWAGIFAVALLMVALVERADWLTGGIHDLFYGRDQIVTVGEVRIAMRDDGHFWVKVQINGVERMMLVDSGATVTALSVATAQAASLDLDESLVDAVIQTANGAVTGRRTTVAKLRIGAKSLIGRQPPAGGAARPFPS